MGMSAEPPRDANLPPGYDEEDPYDDIDLTELPDWWQRNVELFRSFGLRPYRPSRFRDDVLVPVKIEELEGSYDIDIRFSVRNPHQTGNTELLVNGKRVATVDRSREAGGFTRYGMSSSAFVELIHSKLE